MSKRKNCKNFKSSDDFWLFVFATTFSRYLVLPCCCKTLRTSILFFCNHEQQKNCKHERKKWKKNKKAEVGKLVIFTKFVNNVFTQFRLLCTFTRHFCGKLEVTRGRLQTSSKFRRTCEVECFFCLLSFSGRHFNIDPWFFKQKISKGWGFYFVTEAKAKLFVAVWVRALKKKACKITSRIHFLLKSTRCHTWILWGV